MDMEQAALRGNPSFVWRAGQERRLRMIREHAPLENRRVLDVGCGVGMYPAAFRRYTPDVFAVEIELPRAREAVEHAGVAQAAAERLPFPDAAFDLVHSNEVLEHVADDHLAAVEMVRVTRPRGRIVVFVPNRRYFFETHGVYWRGRYHFGNVPLVNWLPDPLRDRLAPHVRAYTRQGLLALFAGLPVRTVAYDCIFPGYDNIVARKPRLGRLLQRLTYAVEGTPLAGFGLSHFLVLERSVPTRSDRKRA